MGNDKPDVKHDKQNRRDANDQAFFKRAQVEAIQGIRHSASARLSSRTQLQVDIAASRITLSDMVARVGIEQRLAVDDGLADIRIEVQEPLGLVGWARCR